MQARIIRKTANIFIVILTLLNIALFIVTLGGGGVLNDLYYSLEEMEDLEKRSLLDNPPENISSVTRREIKLVHNSQGLKEYIKETEANVTNQEDLLLACAALLLIAIAIKIYYRVLPKNS